MSNELQTAAAHPLATPATHAVDADRALREQTMHAARIGLWALGLGLGGFLLWATLAPLDEGVVAPGLVAIDTKRKPVQHLSGGIVREVLVREGQSVERDQVLVRLDEAVARANYEATRQRYLALRATQGRLQAEQGGRSVIEHHGDLRASAADPAIRAQMATQQQLLAARQGALAADLRAVEEGIEGQEAVLRAYAAMLESKRSQHALLSEELVNTRRLVADGYAPRNRELELQRQVADLAAAQSELQGNIARAHRAVAELRQKAIARRQEFRAETQGQLAEVNREAQGEAEKFRALTNELARIEIRAPVAGQVVGLAVQNAGAVIQPAQKLMDIVPADEALLLEAQVQPHFIDRVRAGLPVDIRFSAFAHTPSLVVAGHVVSVSGDLVTDPQTEASYYLARVAVTAEGLKTLGPRRMQSGMPAEVIFKTGERTLLTYLLGPLTKRVAASMKEE